jgi:hypothetical protein
MFEQPFKNIDDILHKDAGCTSELDYTEQSSWLLFLKYLDALEADKAAEAALEGKKYDFNRNGTLRKLDYTVIHWRTDRRAMARSLFGHPRLLGFDA